LLPYEESNRAAHRSAQKTVQRPLFLARGRFSVRVRGESFFHNHQKHLLSCKAGAFSFVPPFCKALYGNRTARPAAAKPAVPAGWDSPADCSTGRGRFSVRVKYRSAQADGAFFCFRTRNCCASDRRLRRIVPPRSEKKPEDGMPTFFNYFGKNVRRELQISAELLFLY